LRFVIEEDEVQSRESLRQRPGFHATAHNGRETLVERGRKRDFLVAYVGEDCVGADDEHDRIRARNQRLDAPPPVFEGVDVTAVNEWLETAYLQRRFKSISERYVLTGVGDEDLGFGGVRAILR
jgi:hypothetical protein